MAGQHTGPPWLAPVILPSHSSARDINNNSTSGFTLLSRVNPFHCSTDCYCSGWPAPNPNPQTPPRPTEVSFLLLSVFISLSHLLLHSFLCSFTESQPALLKTLCALSPKSQDKLKKMWINLDCVCFHTACSDLHISAHNNVVSLELMTPYFIYVYLYFHYLH